MSERDLAIVVVTYNSAAVIENLLDSIPASLDGLHADVIVVDNDSADGTADVVAARADCRLVRAPNDGYSAGINTGVRATEPGLPILALNPDIVLHPGSVAALMRTLRSGVGMIIAPQVRFPDGRLHHSLRREPTIPRTLGLNFTARPIFAEYLNDDAEYVEQRVVDWALGAALLMSRECYDQLGGWDESYFLYSEETDFCLRARDRGWHTVYEPASVVTHIGGGSGQSDLTHSMQLVNRVRLYRRRHGAPLAVVFMALTALREASWITRRRTLSWAALRALLVPRARPAQLNCSNRLIPR